MEETLNQWINKPITEVNYAPNDIRESLARYEAKGRADGIRKFIDLLLPKAIELQVACNDYSRQEYIAIEDLKEIIREILG